MKASWFYILLFLFVTSAPLGYFASSSKAAPVNTPSGKDACLGCHGPFDKLTTAPKTFASESGDKINPHWYVPHNQKDTKGVPECTNCHTPHPLPLTSKGGLPKANVDWCSTCHHTGDLKACNACH